MIDVWSKRVRSGNVAGEKLLGAIRPFRATFGVWVVEGHDGMAGIGQSIPEHHHQRMILIGAGSVSQKDPI